MNIKSLLCRSCLLLGLLPATAFAGVYDFGPSSTVTSTLDIGDPKAVTVSAEQVITLTTKNVSGKAVDNNDTITGVITGSDDSSGIVSSVTLDFTDQDNGTYTARYTPTQASTDTFAYTLTYEITLNMGTENEEAFTGDRQIIVADSSAYYKTTVVSNGGLSPQTQTDFSFFIEPYDSGYRRIGKELDIAPTATITYANASSTSLDVQWDPEEKRYIAAVMPVGGDEGEAELTVKLGTDNVITDQAVTVVGSADIDKTELTIPHGMVGQQTTLSFTVADASGETRGLGGDDLQVSVMTSASAVYKELGVIDHSNGTYTAKYVPLVAGQDRIKYHFSSSNELEVTTQVSELLIGAQTFGFFIPLTFNENTQYQYDYISGAGIVQYGLTIESQLTHLDVSPADGQLLWAVSSEAEGKASQANDGCIITGENDVFCFNPVFNSIDNSLEPASFSFSADQPGDVFVINRITLDETEPLYSGFGSTIAQGVNTLNNMVSNGVATEVLGQAVVSMVKGELDGDAATSEVLMASGPDVYLCSNLDCSPLPTFSSEISVLATGDFSAASGDDLFVGAKDGQDTLCINNDTNPVSFTCTAMAGAAQSRTRAAIFADVNNDLFADLVVARSPENNSGVGSTVYWGDGTGVITADPASNFPLDTNPAQTVTASYFNQDGVLDIALGYAATTDGVANRIYYGEAAATTFDTYYAVQGELQSTPAATVSQLNTVKLISGALYPGGNQDLIELSQYSSDQLDAVPENAYLANDGKGNFTTGIKFAKNNAIDGVLVDVNNSNTADLVVLTKEGLLKAYLIGNDGSINLASTVLALGSSGEALLSGDFDGSSSEDILVAVDSKVYHLDNAGSLFATAQYTAQPCDTGTMELEGITNCVNTGKRGDAGFGSFSLSAVLLILLGVFRRWKLSAVILWLLIPVSVSAAETPDIFLSVEYVRFNDQQSGVSNLNSDLVGFKYTTALPWRQTFFDAQLLMGVNGQEINAGDFQAQWEVDWAYNILLRRDVTITDATAWYVMGGLSYVHTRVAGNNFERLSGGGGGSLGLGIETNLTRSNRVFLEYMAYPVGFETDMSFVSLGVKHRY